MYDDPWACFPYYSIYVACFATFGIVVTLLRVQVSTPLTIFTTVCRFGAIFLILITSIIALIYGEPLATQTNDTETSPYAKYFSAVMATFDATCIINAIPYAVEEARSRDKRDLQKAVIFGLGLCNAFVVLLGFITGLAMGDNTPPQMIMLAYIGYKLPWETSPSVVS